MLKSLILLFVHLISLCCPVPFQARPIDSLNRTSNDKLFEALKLYILYLCKIAHALRVSKHVTESIRNIARGVGIN